AGGATAAARVRPESHRARWRAVLPTALRVLAGVVPGIGRHEAGELGRERTGLGRGDLGVQQLGRDLVEVTRDAAAYLSRPQRVSVLIPRRVGQAGAARLHVRPVAGEAGVQD